jgi:hypothetical protein
MNTIIECPGCRAQLSVKLSFASGPRVSKPQESVFAPDLGTLLDSINRDNLEGRELEFYDKQKERYEQYGEKTLISEKQLKWLNDLAGKGF